MILDRFDIQGASDYEYDVAGIIRKINSRRTGRAVLSYIHSHKETIFIVPYDNYKLVGGDTREKNFHNVLIRFNPTDKLSTIYIMEIEMKQSTYRSAMKLDSFDDDALLHECVHAARFLERVANPIKTKEFGYDDEEEFFAILIENVYRSESGRKYVRKDHTLDVLNDKEADSYAFMLHGDNWRLIEKFCHQLPQIGQAIADIDVQFNPIRTYYEAIEPKVPKEDQETKGWYKAQDETHKLPTIICSVF